MRREIDSHLSLQRELASWLPVPWEVRRVLEDREPPTRPYALVEASTAVTTGPPVLHTIVVPFTLSLFPEVPATRQAADDQALDLHETLWRMVKWGPDAKRPTTDRLPLWDFDADTIPEAQAAIDPAGNAVPWRTGSDWMRVQSFSVNTLRDLADPRAITVVCDVRCAFARGARLPTRRPLTAIRSVGGAALP